MQRSYPLCGILVILLGLSGFVPSAPALGNPWRIAQGPMGPGGMMGGGPMARQGPQQFSSNGERIYTTGMSARIGPIPRAGGPMWIRMMGGGCAACHGPYGRGGTPVMMGTAVPPDIRYEALVSGTYEPGEKATPYTDALIQRAVTQGLDADGKPLDETMPRWQIDDADFADLLVYLKTLQ